MIDEHATLLDQVQGNVTPGFRKDFEDFVFLQFPPEALQDTPDERSAGGVKLRAWLRDLAPSIATAREVATFNRLYRHIRCRTKKHPSNAPASRFIRSTWVNVAFTAIGHRALLGREPWPEGSPPTAFSQGMFNRTDATKDSTRDLAASLVRDSIYENLSIAMNVSEDDQSAQVAHALVIIGADTAEMLDVELARQLELITRYGLTLIERFRGQTLGGGREHFGFRDGISQPDPDDIVDGWTPIEGQIVAQGEFIRGLDPESGHTLPEAEDWEKYGSYLVFRRLSQDVRTFHHAAAEKVQELRCPVDGAAKLTPAQFEAMCVGRLPDGTPLTRAQTHSEGAEAADEKTRFRIEAKDFEGDPAGLVTPRFAHIRKVHPRDNDKDPPQYHRLIRRGIPYGPPFVDGELSLSQADEDRGLLFVGYMASIEDQFEFLLEKWVHFDNFPKLPDGFTAHLAGYDPIIGRVPDQPASLPDPDRTVEYATSTDSAERVQHQTLSLARFVTLTGGGYFFSPSIRHINELAGS